VPRSDTAVVNPQVHNLYLQGRYFTAIDTAEGLSRASDSFQKAPQIDPGYAPAWAGLAHVAMRQVANSYVPVADDIAQATTAAHKSVELDPGFAGGYVELALSRMMSSFDWTGAQEAFDDALRLEPSNTDAQFYSAYLARVIGSPDGSLSRLQQLLDRDACCSGATSRACCTTPDGWMRPKRQSVRCWRPTQVFRQRITSSVVSCWRGARCHRR
jgi:Tfp pilus assembly protein PilF